MASHTRVFLSKLSLPGKLNDELSYVFGDTLDQGPSHGVTLFGVFHMKASDEVYHAIIKETVKNYLDFFHRSPRSVSSPLPDGEFDSNEFVFENAIQFTNERVTDCILREADPASNSRAFDHKKVHFVLGALFGDTLFLNITGDEIHPIYIYPVFRKGGFSHYAIMNIDQSEKESHDVHRLFASIVSGSLSITGSTLTVCNQAFLDYISIDQLKQAATNMPIQNLAGYFEGLLSKAHGRNDFSALFINPHYAGPEHAEKPRSTVSNTSMASLNSTAAGTKTILTPNLPAVAVSGTLKGARSVLSLIARTLPLIITAFHTTTATIRRILRSPAVRSKISTIRRSGLPKVSPAQFLARVQLAGSMVMHHAKRLFTTGAFQETLSSLPARFAALGRGLRLGLVQKLHILSPASKALLILSCVFLILFFQSILSIQAKQKEAKRVGVLQEMFRIADLKSDLAEASLLYENGERARAILLEAETALTYALAVTDAEKQRITSTNDRIRTIRGRISKMMVIQNPAVLADISQVIPNWQSAHLVAVGNKAFLTTPDAVYRIHPENASISQIDTQAKLVGIRCGAALNKNTLALCLGDANRIGLVNIKDEAVKVAGVALHETEKELTHVALYNDRLYTIDAQSLMLYRHQRSGDSFGAGSRWFSGVQNTLASVRDFSVDGTIFTLSPPSTVVQFANGKKTGFSLASIDPPISELTKLWTDDTRDDLYLLEPAGKRIVVIHKKNGLLKNQWQSDAFTDMKDFVVLGKELLVLAGSTLYRIPLK